MARKQITPIQSVVGAANLAVNPWEIETAKQFEVAFVQMFSEDEDKKNRWLEMAVIAPTVIGTHCFDKEKIYTPEGELADEDDADATWHPDYRAMKDILEQALYMKRHKEAMPEISRAKRGEILTAQETEKRARVASVRGGVSQYVNQMKDYLARSLDVPKDAKALPTFTQWAGTAHVALTGKPETTKAKAVAPKISGSAPQVLLDLLAVYTIADNAEHRKAFELWAQGVAKLSANMQAVDVISALQNRPRKVVKSDAAKRTSKVAA